MPAKKRPVALLRSNATRRFLYAALSAATLAAGAAQADIITVGQSGCDFSSIQSAVTAAQSGDTLRLRTQGFVENFNVSKSLTIEGGYDSCGDATPSQLTTITGPIGAGDTVIEITAQQVEVVLRNLVVNGGEDDGRGGGLEVGLGSTVEVDDVAFPLNDAELGGGIYLDASATLRLAGPLSVVGNTATRGGGIYAGSSATILFGSSGGGAVTIDGNSANPSGQGGGIWLGNNALLRTDSAFSTVVSENDSLLGGGIYASAGSRIDTLDLTIENNLAASGGGLFLAGTGGVTPTQPSYWLGTGTTIRDNQALGGGCIYLDDAGGQYLLLQGRCTSNEAIDGAGINMQGEGRLSMHGVLGQNQASGSGGGLFAEAGEITLGGNLVDNSASSGGGAYVRFADVVAQSAQFIANTATSSGGGLYISGGDFNARWHNGFGTNFNQNSAAQQDGGAIYIENGDLLLEYANVGSPMRGNSAPLGAGGGVYHTGFGDVTLVNSQVVDNTAQTGGGIYYGGDGRLTVEANIAPDGVAPARGPATPQCDVTWFLPDRYCSLIRGNSAAFGGGIYIVGSQSNPSAHRIQQTALIDNSGDLASAVALVDAIDVWIRTTLLHGNSDSGDGPNVGVIRVVGNTRLLLDHSTVVDNTGIGLVLSGSTTVTNQLNANIFSGNTADLFAIPGTDALFDCNFSRDGTLPPTPSGGADAPQFIETARGPYRLSDLSPALDACAPTLDQDLDGLTRPIGANADAGALEGAWGIPEVIFRDGFE